jgi:dihydroorotase
MRRITIPRPDDWHLHLRDGEHLRAVLPDSARRFARAIVMPNLKPPVVTVTLYLTDSTPPGEIAAARASGKVHAVKYYPAGATTHSDAGVTDIARCSGALEAMEKHGMPLLVHGEVTDPTVDPFDRERVFVETVLAPLLARHAGLKVVMEHITTREAADFVTAAPPRVAATITAHHLLLSRSALFAGGMRPHLYCLPVLKREIHRQALVKAAVSGNPKFFLGTDSAPHARHTKETDCGCAGIYTAHAGIELYAEAFAAAGALDRLEGFASRHGARYYGLPVNDDTLTLEAESWPVPAEIPFGADRLVPLRAGSTVAWRLR